MNFVNVHQAARSLFVQRFVFEIIKNIRKKSLAEYIEVNRIYSDLVPKVNERGRPSILDKADFKEPVLKVPFKTNAPSENEIPEEAFVTERAGISKREIISPMFAAPKPEKVLVEKIAPKVETPKPVFPAIIKLKPLIEKPALKIEPPKKVVRSLNPLEVETVKPTLKIELPKVESVTPKVETPKPAMVSPVKKFTAPKVETPKPAVSEKLKIPIKPSYGKLIPLLMDPQVLIIECSGAGKPIYVIAGGQKHITNLILSEEEIAAILEKVSQEVHIPLLEGVFRVAHDRFFINAVVSRMIGSKFLIRKQSPMLVFEGEEKY